MTTETIYFGGTPYFLVEASGVFRAVKSLAGSGDNKEIEFDEDVGELIIGRDMREITSRSLSIVVGCSRDAELYPLIVEECRKFAQVSAHDYCGIERVGGKLAKILGPQEEICYYGVTPRLFNKIVNN